MSVTIKAPHDLRALLATMKSARAQRVNMNVWEKDIKTVEDAIETIEAIYEGHRRPVGGSRTSGASSQAADSAGEQSGRSK